MKRLLSTQTFLIVVISLVMVLSIMGCGGSSSSVKYNLTITVSGEGTVEPASGNKFDSGAVVTLTPHANSGSAFFSWSGEHASQVVNNGGVYQITMDGHKNLTAEFVRVLFTETFEAGTAFPGNPWTFEVSTSDPWDVYTEGENRVAIHKNNTNLSHAIIGDPIWDNYAVTVRIKPLGQPTERYAVLARYSGQYSFYALTLSAGNDNNIHLHRYAPSGMSFSGTTLDSSKVIFDNNHFYELRLEVNGAQIRGYFDGVQVLSATDATYVSGKVGMIANTHCFFDDLMVTSVP